MSILEYSIKGKTQKFDTAADVADLIKDLSAMPDVESVVLGGNTFGVEACKAFALELSSKHKLKSVDLSDMFTSRLKSEIPLALDALVVALENKKDLKIVDLSDNAFGPAGAKPLQRLIINNRNIEILKLNNNGLGIEGARLISLALIEAHEENTKVGAKDNLRVFCAGRNRMESPGAEHFSKAFKVYKDSLVHIQMPQNSIRPQGIVQLLECIKECPLEFLDLQDNTFTQLGSAALADAFKSWPKLLTLNVGDCLLGPKGGMGVIKSLTENCPEIQRVALFFNEISEDGAKLVPNMVKQKSKLESIELNGNNFEGDGPVAQSIKDMLRSLGKEECLDELDEMEIDSDVEEYDGLDEDEGIDEQEETPAVDELADLMTKTEIK